VHKRAHKCVEVKAAHNEPYCEPVDFVEEGEHHQNEKNVENDATVTGITMLSEEESVEELARMLGGIEITEAVRNNAIEMKKMAKNQM
jgi:hypothetical protein